MIDEWSEEAKGLENALAQESLSERLARMMFKVDVPMKLKMHENAWDPMGDVRSLAHLNIPPRPAISAPLLSQSLQILLSRVWNWMVLHVQGSITKGEFRVHIRGLGIDNVAVDEIDALFQAW